MEDNYEQMRKEKSPELCLYASAHHRLWRHYVFVLSVRVCVRVSLAVSL